MDRRCNGFRYHLPMPVGRLIGFVAGALCIAGCTDRKETPEFFSQYARVPLCPSARLRNVNEETKSGFSGPDIVYEVDLYMNEHCNRELRRNLFNISSNKPDCIYAEECTFTVRPDITYSVVDLGDRVRFVYRD